MERVINAVKGKVAYDYSKAVEMAEAEGFGDNLIAWGLGADKDIVIKPTYMTEKAVGADCFASEEVIIAPNQIKVVFTGIKARFNGMEEGLFPFIRSSIPKKKGLMLANGVGVVEEDYCDNPDNDGNIGFLFWNYTDKPVTVHRFERLGQIVLMPILRFDNAERIGTERSANDSFKK